MHHHHCKQAVPTDTKEQFLIDSNEDTEVNPVEAATREFHAAGCSELNPVATQEATMRLHGDLTSPLASAVVPEQVTVPPLQLRPSDRKCRMMH